MRQSQKGLEFLMNQEGLRLKPYKCEAGVWTVGVGHVIPKKADGEYAIPINKTISKAFALELLMKDCERFERVVSQAIHRSLTQAQFDALVSLAFNIGEFAFKTSTLVKLINNNYMQKAGLEFLRWCHDNGHESEGLLARRKREKALFETGKY